MCCIVEVLVKVLDKLGTESGMLLVRGISVIRLIEC